ncbi:DEAD/DEAH box helicase [Limosilactobacillus reuteri]|uniref:DEAD/DEAH box helicase n=1 Tax=Limosilactobacillus reuteri TaxID=1598 RepID=UPI001E44808B|nr:DEAD/DEAH box helicase [Limosilactobacillus reuteri]MCC4381378.1 DEAD/DEAH box helicase [Limosilactobacillus reuteri]
MSNWRNLFAQRIYERGRDYYYRGRVKNLIFDEDDNFSAIVKGNRAYKVTGRYHNGKFSQLHCDCPYAQDNHRCKHMAAVLEAIDGDDSANVEPQKSLGEVFQSAFPPSRLPVAPQSFLSKEVFPLQLIEHVFTNLDNVQIISESLIKAADAYFTIPGAKWNYSVDGRFKQYYFSVLVAFNRKTIVDVQVNFVKTREGQQIAKMVALYYLLKYLDQHNIEENTNEAARQMLANFLDRDPNSQTIITANIGEYYDGGQYLYFRAGVPDHMYKFPNLPALTNGIARGERLRLGKFFDQQIIPENLDKDSKQWLDLIIKLSSTADLTRDGYYEASVKNELPLAGVIMDEVDQILKTGNTLYNRWKVPIKREKQVLKAAISIKANGADDDPSRHLGVSVDLPADLIHGHVAYYHLDDHTWTAFTGIAPDKLDPVFPVTSDLVFGVDTMAEFYRYVLPKLQSMFSVELPQDRDLSKFLPSLPTVVFLLDYHDEQIYCDLATETDGKTQKIKKIDDLPQFLMQRVERVLAKYFTNFNQTGTRAVLLVDEATNLLATGVNELQEIGITKATPAFNGLYKQPFTKVSVGISVDSGLLKLDFGDDQLTAKEIKQILRDFRPHKQYYQLGKKTLKMDEPSLTELVEILRKMGISSRDLTVEELKLPVYRALYLDDLLSHQEALNYRTTSELRQLVTDVKTPQKDFKIPTNLHATLRPYQRDGVQWLMTLMKYHFGGLLADEMGLGKTLQIITVLLSEQGNGQSLIVAPAAVIYNWRDEINKFAPDLKVTVLDGSKAERRKQFTQSTESDIIITSYDAAKRDIDFYEGHVFSIEVIDEAQYIKNPQTAAAKTVKAINAKQRFALTGTPIENRLSELWSIFEYLMPGLLGSYQQFRKQYEGLIIKNQDEQAQDDLKRLVQPFMLRRLKKDVLNDLPMKNEQVFLTPMVGKQESLYQARAQRLIRQIQKQNDEEFQQNKLAVLAEITRLRELCCSPQLLDDGYSGPSGKIKATMNLIKDEMADNHKILLFSQFTSALAILKEKLANAGIKYFVIEGKTKKADRLQFVDEFNSYDQPAVFLISLKAGGTGLNLTSADVVIHFDPWWNIAAENQATDRAHRIGQKNNVTIYKMIAQNTIEEKIVEMQQKKAALANFILSGNELANAVIDKETLLSILK